MSIGKSLHIVDENVARRTALLELAVTHGHQCAVFNSLQDFFDGGKDTGILLLHDDAQTTQFLTLSKMMVRAERWIAAGSYADKPNLPLVIQAVRLGALSFCATPQSAADLEAALNVLEVEIGRQRRLREMGLKAYLSLSKLTKRERQVLDYVMEGGNTKDIAQHLSISTRTVEVHRLQMLAKIGAKNSADAVRVRLHAEPYLNVFV